MPEIITFQDLESYWKDLRPNRIDVSVAERTSVNAQLEELRAEMTAEITKFIDTAYPPNTTVSSAMLANIMVTTITQFMMRWYEHMKHFDLAYLVEVILDAQKDLPLTEVKGFIRALPMTILSRLLNESRGQMTGLHALVACEVRRRDGELQDYDIRKDAFGKLIVSFTPPPDRRNTQSILSFSLRDIFAGT